ncbi:MAG: hypothetical protein ACXAC5_04800 [Promethearchaeota archaeon]|jgi:hypothetical protein
MGKKKKIKLTKEQKVWLENLQWYLKNKVNWVGDQDLRDCVIDGKYAILSVSHEPMWWDCFDGIMCTDSMDSVKCIIEWSPCCEVRVVELEHLDIMLEVYHSRGPDWSNMRQKYEQESK